MIQDCIRFDDNSNLFKKKFSKKNFCNIKIIHSPNLKEKMSPNWIEHIWYYYSSLRTQMRLFHLFFYINTNSKLFKTIHQPKIKWEFVIDFHLFEFKATWDWGTFKIALQKACYFLIINHINNFNKILTNALCLHSKKNHEIRKRRRQL